MPQQRVIIVSGLSGAGKSTALHALEDMGFYCVDNLPIALLPALGQELARSDTHPAVAVGIDARNLSDLQAFPGILGSIRASGADCQVLFFTADRQTLINRYNETRRQHPLAGKGGSGSVSDAIDAEQALLAPIAELADLLIDSSGQNIYQLRNKVRELLSHGPRAPLLVFQSFGYKFGTPLDADMVFDMRCLPNPHWQPALRELTGRDGPVQDFLAAQPDVERMFQSVSQFLEAWLPAFADSDRSQLTVGIGCTGGRHRSVYMAERLGQHFTAGRALTPHGEVLVRHRQLGG